jgi:hypothetical protein
MRIDRWGWILVCAFLVLACATRLYRLDWSFSGDETSTFSEVLSLIDKPFFASDLELGDRLPRAHPVAYGLQLLTYRVFGQGDFGTRVGVATAGTLSIALIVLLTYLLFGRLSAIFVGILLVLWPWHVLHSQTNRMYIYAFLFGSVALLSGALAWQRNSFSWASLSGIAAALAISSHNLAAIIPASFGIYAVVDHLTTREPAPRRAIAGYAVVGAPLIGLSTVVAVLAMRGWAGEVGSGYSIAHTLMGVAYNMTYGVAVLALVGWFGAWRSDSRPLRMIAVTATVAAITCVLLPAFVSFRHDYVFASSIAFVLLANQTLAEAFTALREHSRFLAWGMAAAFLLLPLPSFASYYQDGDRNDYRAAAEYIKAHWQEDDLVAADSPGPLGYYLPRTVTPAHRPSTEPKEWVKALEKLAATGKRVWYVCRYAREEPPQWADQWLWQNSVRMLRIKKQRFDYHENITDVYILRGNTRPGCDAAPAAPLAQRATQGKDG